MPADHGIDLVSHELVCRTSAGEVRKIALRPVSVAQLFWGVLQDTVVAWRFRKDQSDAGGGRKSRPVRHRRGSLRLRQRCRYAFLACAPNRGYASETLFD
jgi:hypothetical protein